MSMRGRSRSTASVSPAAWSSRKVSGAALLSATIRAWASTSSAISIRNCAMSHARKPPLASASAAALDASVISSSL